MSEIKNWYADKNVLITGATGFVGKVLVERILRECDHVNCIYLIVRGKQNFEKRCHEFLNHIVFDHLREFKPEQIKKIKIFQGDLSQENVGLDNDNLTEIENNVDIVLHSGADVRFDLKLRDALTTNTIGTYRLLELAKRIKKLQVFVLVSTTYSQSHQKVTEERHYDAEMDVFALMKAFDRFDDETMAALQSKILKEFPNSYSFSKHLSEDIVYRYRNEFPICIVRPSVVIGAFKHPIPGYTEGLNGFNGWGLASMRGVMRTAFLDKSCYYQIIPVDIVANTIIATSWLHGSKKLDDNVLQYYNVNMSQAKQMTFSEGFKFAKPLRFKYPLNWSIWSPNNTITTCVYYYYFRIIFYQILPSALLDLLLWIFLQKPIMLKIQRKVYYVLSLVNPYLKIMTFETDEFKNIRNYLNQTDRDIFDTNTDYTLDYIIRVNAQGFRKFIAKEKEEDLPRARRNIIIWYWIHTAMQCIVCFYLVKFIFDRFVYKL